MNSDSMNSSNSNTSLNPCQNSSIDAKAFNTFLNPDCSEDPVCNDPIFWIDLSDYSYDISECISPTPSSGCDVYGAAYYFICEPEPGVVEISLFDIFNIEIENCFSTIYIDIECVEEEVLNTILPFMVQNAVNYTGADPNSIYTLSYYKQLCGSYCYTDDPYPSYVLNLCEDSYACCVQERTWAPSIDPISKPEGWGPYYPITTSYESFGSCEGGTISACSSRKGEINGFSYPCSSRYCYSE